MARPRLPRITCEYCGDEFPRRPQRGRIPRFCSPEHRQLAAEENKIKRIQAENRRMKKQLKLAVTALELSTLRAKRGHAQELHAVLEKLEIEELVAA